MKLLQVAEQVPIPGECHGRCKGIAYDGTYLYISNPQDNLICCFTTCLKQACTYTTCRGYTSICYDACERCFWACACECASKIYKLNCTFEEIDCIYISNVGEACGSICGIDCGGDKSLYVCFANALIEVCKRTGRKIATLQRRAAGVFTSVASCEEQYALSGESGGCTDIRLYDSCGCEEIRCCIESCCKIEDMTCVCGEHCTLYVLARKMCKYCCLIKVQIGCEKPGCGQGCNDIIESVALEQAALAHILNAEGEKIQMAVKSGCSTKELIEVNNSVQRTITHITHLEQILFSKLELAEKICKHPCENVQNVETER